MQAVLGGSLHPGGAQLTKEMARAAGLGPGDRILDPACGDGASAVLLARDFGCRVTGLDIDPAQVESARRRAYEVGVSDRCRFEAAAAGPPDGRPSPAKPFDAVLSECSLCLHPGMADTLRWMHGLLRPGGKLLLSDVTVESPDRFDGAAAFAACLGGAGPKHRLEAAVADAGFTVDSFEDRRGLLCDLRDRVRQRIDVEGILDALGANGLRDLVTRAEAELDAGRIGYAVVHGRR